MKWTVLRRSGRLVLAIIAAGAFAVGPVCAQTTATWFDINPSRSNLDDSDPNGASGGRVNRVGAAADFSKVYAATEWGGLYQSFDQGNTWVRIQTFSPSAAWDVKVDPANNQRVYATSSFDGRVTPQSGISISNDAGATWTAVNQARNPLTCALGGAGTEPTGWQIAINANNTRTVFVGTNCGLARSLDAGATWDFVDPTPLDLTAEPVFAVVAHGRTIVDVIGTNGFVRSPDNGATWSAVIAGPGPVAGVVTTNTTLAVSPGENYVLLAANTQRPPAPAARGINIWESVDGGLTWPTSLTPPTLGGASIAQ